MSGQQPPKEFRVRREYCGKKRRPRFFIESRRGGIVFGPNGGVSWFDTAKAAKVAANKLNCAPVEPELDPLIEEYHE